MANEVTTKKASAVPQIQTHALFMAQEHWLRLETLAKRAYDSGILPASIKNVSAAFIVALKGVSLGLDPMFAMEHIAIINGKATIDGQAMLALIYASNRVKVTFGEAAGTVTMQRSGQDPVTKTWTLERAKQADLTGKDPWKKYPDQMLTWRAVSECARLVAPDVIGGLHLHEELGATVDEDGKIIHVEPERIAAAKNVTPPEATPQAAASTSKQEPWNPQDPATTEDRSLVGAASRESGWVTADLVEAMQKMFQKEKVGELQRYQVRSLVDHMRANPKPPPEQEPPREPGDDMPDAHEQAEAEGGAAPQVGA